MKCSEQEKTATSPLRRPNSLHHQQHFINNRRLVEQGSSPQTQTDARTIVLLLLLHPERLKDIQKKKPLYPTAKKQTTHTHGSLRVALLYSHSILGNCYHVSTISGFFSETLMLLRLSVETHIKRVGISLSSTVSQLCSEDLKVFPLNECELRVCWSSFVHPGSTSSLNWLFSACLSLTSAAWGLTGEDADDCNHADLTNTASLTRPTVRNGENKKCFGSTGIPPHKNNKSC